MQPRTHYESYSTHIIADSVWRGQSLAILLDTVGIIKLEYLQPIVF